VQCQLTGSSRWTGLVGDQVGRAAVRRVAGAVPSALGPGGHAAGPPASRARVRMV